MQWIASWYRRMRKAFQFQSRKRQRQTDTLSEKHLHFSLTFGYPFLLLLLVLTQSTTVDGFILHHKHFCSSHDYRDKLHILKALKDGNVPSEVPSEDEQDDNVRDVKSVSQRKDENKEENNNRIVPATPCVRICRYNADFYDGAVCIGCFREAYEIQTWASSSPQERIYTLEDALDRQEEARDNHDDEEEDPVFPGSISREDLLCQLEYYKQQRNVSNDVD